MESISVISQIWTTKVPIRIINLIEPRATKFRWWITFSINDMVPERDSYNNMLLIIVIDSYLILYLFLLSML